MKNLLNQEALATQEKNRLDLAQKLHDSTASELNDHEKDLVKRYTRQTSNGNTGSLFLNKNLVKGVPLEKLVKRDQETHKMIMEHSKPSGHEVHLFSGTSRNFENLNKHTKDNIFHFPAHTSLTHHRAVAADFAIDKAMTNNLDDAHIMHVHVKPHDKILHVSRVSDMPSEYETILPAGTKLKYHGSSEHEYNNDNYKVHHFTIHSQE
jgi:hypothetical protein